MFDLTKFFLPLFFLKQNFHLIRGALVWVKGVYKLVRMAALWLPWFVSVGFSRTVARAAAKMPPCKIRGLPPGTWQWSAEPSRAFCCSRGCSSIYCTELCGCGMPVWDDVSASGFPSVARSGFFFLKLLAGRLNYCDLSCCSLQYLLVLLVWCWKQVMKECEEYMLCGIKPPSVPPDCAHVLWGHGSAGRSTRPKCRTGCSPGCFCHFPGILSS